MIALECDGEPQADSTRLLATNVTNNLLRVFDAKLEGALYFGPGKSTDAHVTEWNKLDEAVVWPIRLNQKATFDVSLSYDAPTKTQPGKREGDAGAEQKAAHKGAGGSFVVTIGGTPFPGTVKQGNSVRVSLGSVTLEPGTTEIRISAKGITGEELFRPRSITLTPVK